MTNEGLYKLIEVVLKNRKELNIILDYLDAGLLGKGILAVPEGLVNQALRDRILGLSDKIQFYNFLFTEGHILMDTRISVPKIGGVSMQYKFAVNDFVFGDNGHRLIATFTETANADGKMGQIALSAAKMKGSLLQTAVGMSKLKDAIFVTDDTVAIDLEKLDFMKDVPTALNLQYISAVQGSLRLKYWLD